MDSGRELAPSSAVFDPGASQVCAPAPRRAPASLPSGCLLVSTYKAVSQRTADCGRSFRCTRLLSTPERSSLGSSWGAGDPGEVWMP